MFSQFFVLSLRGDTILHKDCKCRLLIHWQWQLLYIQVANAVDRRIANAILEFSTDK